MRAERLQRSAKVRARGVDGESQGRGDLLVCEVGDVLERDDLALAWGKLVEGGRKVDPRVDVVPGVRSLGRGGKVAFASANLVDGEIGCDTRRPCRSTCCVQGRPPFEHATECLGRDVFGLGSIVQNAPRCAGRRPEQFGELRFEPIRPSHCSLYVRRA